MRTSDRGQTAGGGGAATVEVDNDRTRLERLERVLVKTDGLMREAVTLAGRLAGSGTCEKVEGLPLDVHLGLVARMTGADRAMLLTAGQVLAGMPQVSGLWECGALSWGLVRGIVARVKRLSSDDRAVVDARIGATWARWEGLDAYSPDRLLDQVDRAVDERRQARSVERRETRRAERSFVAIQPSLDGSGGSVYAELDAPGLAAFANALDDAAPDSDPSDGDGHHEPSGGDGKTSRGWEVGRGRQRAEGLRRICEHWLAGTTGRDGKGGGGVSRRRAKPLFLVHVDLKHVSAVAAGQVELGVAGGLLPRLTARLTDLLAEEADLQAVIFDGARPLAASKPVAGVSAGGAGDPLEAPSRRRRKERPSRPATRPGRGERGEGARSPDHPP